MPVRRIMVNRLAAVLGAIFRQHNEMLTAAGFAPEWPQRDWLRLISPRPLGHWTTCFSSRSPIPPSPSIAIELLRANSSREACLNSLLILPRVCQQPRRRLSARMSRPYLRNWEEVRHFIKTVEADAFADGTHATAAFLERLLNYRGVRSALRQTEGNGGGGPVIAMNFRKSGVSLRMFTTLATLGTPQDVTLEELRIESFFPLDDETDAVLRSWVS